MATKAQLLIALAVLAFASSAAAAEYTVVACNGQAAATGGWTLFASGPQAALSESCASGGAMTAILRGNQSPVAGNAGWQVSAPANTAIAGATLYRKVGVAGTGYGYVARALAPAAANNAVLESCSGPSGCKQEVARTSFAWRAARADLHRLQAYVQCVAPCQALSASEAAAVRVSRVDLALSDTEAPMIASGPSSAMFAAGGPVSGVQSITTTFKDAGGGVAATGVQVDGRTVSEVPVSSSSCRAPYRKLVPCPLTVSTTLQFNPAGVSDGAHQIRVFARDATGANVGYSSPLAVTTSARGAVNGRNGSDDVRLSVGVRRPVKAGHRAPRARSTITVSYGSKSVISGRLRNGDGQPIVGARMVVGTAVDRGVPQFADVAANVVTDSDGRFKLALPAGPSLRVRVSYFARALDAMPAGRGSARVKVTSKATLRPVHRHLGSRVRATFRGRVLGRFRPAGIRVELQGRRGRSYVTLATAATKPDGSYRVTYRFTHRARGRYVFRLRVRHYPRFPYFLGYSRATSVFVR
ncbi:MAG TPA: carboxypeptidase-like regulatory domain-containing protein [Solirubrobacteraceae bacterium]|nr:carboxypeptidase-like regulatory domain-containing protein [Solirubrobacteraceae bacterium]